MALAVFDGKVNQQKVSKSDSVSSAANNNYVVKKQENNDNPRKNRKRKFMEFSNQRIEDELEVSLKKKRSKFKQ